ncbi:hypothetical protein ACHHV8_26120 [Paenibacillus sp. TAB 01]|uniref:hypothetical protein n=1 Tax=Paenibacillus sp. TAB 01 TaxID=3368988 RepID=UPI00375257BE
MLYVSHRMEEIFKLSDRITVLRNGMKVDTVAASGLTREALIRLMSGHNERDGEARALRSRAGASRGPVLLRAEGMKTADGIVKHADLAVYGQEIVGVFGLAGAGRSRAAGSHLWHPRVRGRTSDNRGTADAVVQAFPVAAQRDGADSRLTGGRMP